MTPREVVDLIETMANNGCTRTQILGGLSVELHDDKLAHCGAILTSIYDMAGPQDIWWIYSFRAFHQTEHYDLKRVDPETGLRRLGMYGGYEL